MIDDFDGATSVFILNSGELGLRVSEVSDNAVCVIGWSEKVSCPR
jgi:hypothetical protein